MTWSIGSEIRNLDHKRTLAPLEKVDKTKATSPAGFSLLELLVVVAIIGSILALSLPRFRGTFNNLKFDNFCQNLTSRMRYLQERAALEQKSYRLVFDSSNKIISIEAIQEDSNNFTAVKGLLGKKITIPERLEVSVEESDVLFYPNGTIDGNNIVISDDQNKATIYITESVGRIELKRNEE